METIVNRLCCLKPELFLLFEKRRIKKTNIEIKLDIETKSQSVEYICPWNVEIKIIELKSFQTTDENCGLCWKMKIKCEKKVEKVG